MTHGDPDELARTVAIDFARRLVPHWQEALSTELLGAYLIGSVAHAGATAISTSHSSLRRDYPHRRSIACVATLSVC
jgi:hypothetical protein